jgi:hypothetical protein
MVDHRRSVPTETERWDMFVFLARRSRQLTATQDDRGEMVGVAQLVGEAASAS